MLCFGRCGAERRNCPSAVLDLYEIFFRLLWVLRDGKRLSFDAEGSDTNVSRGVRSDGVAYQFPSDPAEFTGDGDPVRVARNIPAALPSCIDAHGTPSASASKGAGGLGEGVRAWSRLVNRERASGNGERPNAGAWTWIRVNFITDGAGPSASVRAGNGNPPRVAYGAPIAGVSSCDRDGAVVDLRGMRPTRRANRERAGRRLRRAFGWRETCGAGNFRGDLIFTAGGELQGERSRHPRIHDVAERRRGAGGPRLIVVRGIEIMANFVSSQKDERFIIAGEVLGKPCSVKGVAQGAEPSDADHVAINVTIGKQMRESGIMDNASC